MSGTRRSCRLWLKLEKLPSFSSMSVPLRVNILCVVVSASTELQGGRGLISRPPLNLFIYSSSTSGSDWVSLAGQPRFLDIQTSRQSAALVNTAVGEAKNRWGNKDKK